MLVQTMSSHKRIKIQLMFFLNAYNEARINLNYLHDCVDTARMFVHNTLHQVTNINYK